MESVFRKGVLVGLGLLSMTRERVEEMIDDLAEKGEISKDEQSRMVREFMDKAEAKSQETQKWIDERIKEAMDRFRPKELEKIENIDKKCDQLEQQVVSLQKEVAKLKSTQKTKSSKS